MKKFATLFAAAILGLAACAPDASAPEPSSSSADPGPALGVSQGALTGSIPVTVVNGASDPVQTTVKGTAQIAGTVGLAAGTSVGLAAGATVAVAGTPNVQVVSMPKVEVAGTPNVNVVSMPSVLLAGTPTVNVANLPGSLSNTTELAFRQVANINTGALERLDNVDVSAFREVRVVATATGVSDYQLFVVLVDETSGALLILDSNITGTEGSGTRLYSVPGRRMSFILIGPSFGSSAVTISVFGRGG